MPNSFTDLNIHFVWATWDRAPLLSTEHILMLRPYVAGILKNTGGFLHNCGGYRDHVHVLAQFPARKSVAEIAQLIKCNTTRWIKEDLGIAGFQWQGAYSGFTVSRSRIASVSSYIDRQEEHHRVVTFDEEIKRFLDASGQ